LEFFATLVVVITIITIRMMMVLMMIISTIMMRIGSWRMEVKNNFCYQSIHSTYEHHLLISIQFASMMRICKVEL
jgi:hypothetical protein